MKFKWDRSEGEDESVGCELYTIRAFINYFPYSESLQNGVKAPPGAQLFLASRSLLCLSGVQHLHLKLNLNRQIKKRHQHWWAHVKFFVYRLMTNSTSRVAMMVKWSTLRTLEYLLTLR